MSWHYQVRRRVIDGEKVFDIVEKYGKSIGWTENSIAPWGESKKELIHVLEMMLVDAKMYPSFYDNGDLQ